MSLLSVDKHLGYLWFLAHLLFELSPFLLFEAFKLEEDALGLIAELDLEATGGISESTSFVCGLLENIGTACRQLVAARRIAFLSY